MFGFAPALVVIFETIAELSCDIGMLAFGVGVGVGVGLGVGVGFEFELDEGE